MSKCSYVYYLNKNTLAFEGLCTPIPYHYLPLGFFEGFPFLDHLFRPPPFLKSELHPLCMYNDQLQSAVVICSVTKCGIIIILIIY